MRMPRPLYAPQVLDKRFSTATRNCSGVYGFAKKSKLLDEHGLHPVRDALARCVKNWHIGFSFNCFLRQHHSGIRVGLKGNVRKDDIDFFATFNEGEGLVDGTGRKSFVATLLKDTLSEHPNLLVVFHDHYERHDAPHGRRYVVCIVQDDKDTPQYYVIFYNAVGTAPFHYFASGIRGRQPDRGYCLWVKKQTCATHKSMSAKCQ